VSWLTALTYYVAVYDVSSCSKRMIVRGMAMKFPEWFIASLVPVSLQLTERNDLQITPPGAVAHLAQRFGHYWQHFWKSCCGISFSGVVTFFGYLQYLEIFVTLRKTLFFVISQKSFGAKSGEQDGCSISVVSFWATNCLNESNLWAGALSWWRIQWLGLSSGLFLRIALHNSFSISK
jgi:hypothetical protein